MQKLKNDKKLSKRFIKLWLNDLKFNSYFLPRYINKEGVKPPVFYTDNA